jgi:hypothetical protein
MKCELWSFIYTFSLEIVGIGSLRSKIFFTLGSYIIKNAPGTILLQKI